MDVNPPACSIGQSRHRHIVSLDYGAEELGLVTIPGDWQRRLGVDANAAELAQALLNLIRYRG